MPERLAYDEAMQLSAIRLKVQDSELKQGKVEMVSVKTAKGSIERPWGIEGGFAVVYKFRKKSGEVCALRCFRVPMSSDTQYRYERIGPYFHTHAREITAGFKYYDAAIVVKEQGKPQNQAYPVIEMDWIDGVTLVDKINELCRKRNRAALKNLAEQWLNILRILRNARIAHGDLAGVNVMIGTDGRMVLIDYDGVYIPEFAGLAQVLVGQDDFQHPDMAHRAFHEHMDSFSALVIYTALVALAAKPELWDTYAKVGADGKLLDVNILFRRQDFQHPQQSPLFRDLEQITEQRVKTIVQELKQACHQSINDVKFPFTRIDQTEGQKQALAALERAIQANDDERIVTCWLPSLEHYPPVQRHQSRVQLAQQRIALARQQKQALQTMQAAFVSKNIEQIAAAYPLVQNLKGLTHEERKRAELAVAFMQTYSANDDDAFLAAYRAIQHSAYRGFFLFTQAQEQRATLIQKRKAALERFRVALASRSFSDVVRAYDTILDNYQQVTPTEREQLALARILNEALQSDDDDVLINADIALQQSLHRTVFLLTDEEKQRINAARQRKAVLLNFRNALKGRKPDAILAAYSTILDANTSLSQEEREKISIARLFIKAFDTDDDDALISLGEALQKPGVSNFLIITPQEQERIALAKQRSLALERFRQALISTPKIASKIVEAYDASLLDASVNVTDEQREVVAAARRYLSMCEALKTGIRTDNDDLIRSVYDATLAQRFTGLSLDEQQRIDRAMLSQKLEDQLNNKEYEQALMLAQSIQKITGREISASFTFKLKRATMRFIREQNLTQLAIHIEDRADSNYATVSWLWPASTLVHVGLIVWRTDTWPDEPSEKSWRDPEWRYVWVRRKNDVLQDSCTFSIGKGVQMYVRGYAAILDTWDQEKTWRFSDGDEPSSFAQATSPQLTWHIQ